MQRFKISFPMMFLILFLVAGTGCQHTAAQDDGSSESAESSLRNGKNFLRTRVYSKEENQRILKLYEDLMVADVVDGMDAIGLQNIGNMSPDIHPLWKDTKTFDHAFTGIAVTVRYVPTNEPRAGTEKSPEEYNKWRDKWYSEKSPEPFVPLIREGTALVIDDAEQVDVGTIGSNNILNWKKKGCAGVVTDATARDTDEIAAQKVPLYFKEPGRGIRPGRNEIESVNRPVEVGGVLVEPGDVIVADGDGVVVVPRKHAEEVARYARDIYEKRQKGRREMYEQLDLPEDESVK